MRRPTLFLALLASVVVLPKTSAAWEHNAVRWPDERFPLPLVLHPTAARDTPLDELEAIVIESINTWNDVSCSYAELDYIGQNDLPIAIDGDQVLKWTTDAANWVYGSSTAGATIIDVITGTPRIDILFNDISFRWIAGANTFVLPGHRWGPETPVDLDPASVITHELGHLLGLSHPNPSIEGSQPDPLATMVFALLPNAQQATLAADDKLGLCARYPVDAPDECEDDSDCSAIEFCREVEPVGAASMQMCDETRSGVGEECGRNNYGCFGICLFQSADYVEGFCTEYCELDEECPDGWDCLSVEATTGDMIDICLPEGSVPEEDVGAGQNDAGGPTIVEDPPDAGDDEVENEDVEVVGEPDAPADVASDDAAGESDAATAAGREHGCAAAAPASSMLFPALFALVGIRRRRRQ